MTTARRRVVVEHVGGPEVLRVVTDAAPEPGPGQVRLRVLAAGLARADLLMRAGCYPGPAPRPPFVAGWDATGVVDACGPGAEPSWAGRRALALTLTGGHASHVVVPESGLVAVPDGVDTAAAACLPLNYLTAYEMLHHAARVRPGERVLVHGAAGAVGTALLDVGRLLGAETYGVARPADRRLVQSFGASHVDRSGWERMRADVVLDPVGGAHVRRSFRALRPGGRLVAYGFLADGASPLGGLARLRMWDALPNGRRAAFYRLSVAARRNPRRLNTATAALVAALAAGRLRPVVAACVPLDAAAEAHRLLAAGTLRGKVLLAP
ncbi:zinc-binding dehydrogenase [Micromonospora sp. NPDC000668]|uniref:zinc-binding dehydrogenase n=1 Tax=Micromonospora sp. NPDC000668 TaxID=3364219 RepID=UPI0036B5EBC4